MSIYNKILDGPWYKKLMVNTDSVINEVFTKYKPIYDYIVGFIKKHELQVSNNDLIMNGQITYDKPLHIYVIDPHAVALKLFKELCTKFKSELILQIESQDKHYSINQITKTYIRITYAETYKDISILDYLAPIKINNIKLMPPILELIDLYKKIYNPEYVDQWETLINESHHIKQITDKNIQDTIASRKSDMVQKKESSAKSTKRHGGKCDNCADKYIAIVIAHTIEFIKKYTDYVLLFPVNSKEVRHLSIFSMNTIQTDFERLNNYLAASNVDFTIIFKKKKLFLGKDYRIEKYSLYISIAEGSRFSNVKADFLDIYNNLSYELVPYTTINDIKTAYPWVQIRFYYINIWNILAAYYLKLIKYVKVVSLVNDEIKKYGTITVQWNVPPTEYAGIYINEQYAFKKIMMKDGVNSKLYCDSDLS